MLCMGETRLARFVLLGTAEPGIYALNCASPNTKTLLIMEVREW